MQVDEFKDLASWFKTNVWELSDSDEDVDSRATVRAPASRKSSLKSEKVYSTKKPNRKTPRMRKTVTSAYDYDPRSDVVKRQKLSEEQILFEHIVGLDNS